MDIEQANRCMRNALLHIRYARMVRLVMMGFVPCPVVVMLFAVGLHTWPDGPKYPAKKYRRDVQTLFRQPRSIR